MPSKATKTTGEIIGKAHRLCEWLRSGDVPLMQEVSSIPISWGVELSDKWHIGSAENIPNNIDAEILKSIPFRLPSSPMLIEVDTGIAMADGRTEPATQFILCYDRGNEEIDIFLFINVCGRFLFYGCGCSYSDISASRDRKYKIFDSKGIGREEGSWIINSMIILDGVLLALSCINICSVDNNPPEKINKKRLKGNKPPLFTYKTLHLVSGGKSNIHSSSEEECDRRGPRLHFRRGHVRRIGGGRLTWVSNCMVGNKNLGLVEKAYSLTVPKGI